MAFKQLDLFDSLFSAPEEKMEQVNALKSTTNNATLQQKESYITNGDEPRTTVDEEKDVVYRDNLIQVKIKKKEQVFLEAETTIDEIRTIKTPQKRGRKSTSEINKSLVLMNIPDDETLKLKMYHSITEVAKMFGVNNSLIRHWENEFDILQPRKSRKGDRHFRYEDIKNLIIIYQLLKVRKFSIEGAKEYLKNKNQNLDLNIQLFETLNKLKTFLLDLKANLDHE